MKMLSKGVVLKTCYLKLTPHMQGSSAPILAGFKGLGLQCLFSHVKGLRQTLQGKARICITHPVWKASCGSSLKHLPSTGRGGGGWGWGVGLVMEYPTVVAKNGRIWGGGRKSGKDNERGGVTLPSQVGAYCVLPKGWLWGAPH